MPDQLLKKGDSVKLLISPKEYYSDDEYVFISDIEVFNTGWINKSKRNEIAKADSYRRLLVICIAFISLLVIAGTRYFYIKIGKLP